MVRMGQGTLPAIIAQLRYDFNMTNTQVGALGCLIYVGGIVGSLVAMPTLPYFKTKNVIVASVFFQIVSLVVFMTSKTFAQQTIARFMAGFFQVFV
jgi:predicted MFS family arabinose efflux permease